MRKIWRRHKKHSFIIILSLICSCTAHPFKEHHKGLLYQIISSKQSDLVRPGEILKLQVRQMYNDSLLNDTRDSIPFYQVYDSSRLSKESSDILGQLRQGDSVTFKALTDSVFKGKLPAFAHKGQWLVTTLKVERIFGVKEDFREDLKKEIEKRRGYRRPK
jgi:hypothetical protein